MTIDLDKGLKQWLVGVLSECCRISRLAELENILTIKLSLGAYLLKPVQLILKYHIPFQSLIKHTTGIPLNLQSRLIMQNRAALDSLRRYISLGSGEP